MERLVLFPILNEKTTTIPGPVLDLSERVSVKKISDEMFSAFFEVQAHLKNGVTPQTKCVHAQLTDEENSDDAIRRVSALAKFALNFFAAEGSLLLSCAAYAEKKRKVQVKKFFNLPLGGERETLSKVPFKMGPDGNADAIKTYYSTIEVAHKSKSSVLVAIERFNSVFSRESFEEKIIDLSIALETLIPDKNELKFRFSLYHSFLSEPDPTKRMEIFKLFQTLYDVRSGIVHGSSSDKDYEKKAKKISDDFQSLLTCAKKSLNYYFYYLQGPNGDWGDHLKSLVIAQSERAV